MLTSIKQNNGSFIIKTVIPDPDPISPTDIEPQKIKWLTQCPSADGHFRRHFIFALLRKKFLGDIDVLGKSRYKLAVRSGISEK